MKKCPLCANDDPAIPVRCRSCWKTFHLHDSQVQAAPLDAVMVANCPECGAHNMWVRALGLPKVLGVLAKEGLSDDKEGHEVRTGTVIS